MKIHELKTDPSVFAESWAGTKPFEIRNDDRGFQVCDLLILRETRYSGEEMRNGKPLEYTGRVLSRTVISRVSGYGLADGWVVLGVQPI